MGFGGQYPNDPMQDQIVKDNAVVNPNVLQAKGPSENHHQLTVEVLELLVKRKTFHLVLLTSHLPLRMSWLSGSLLLWVVNSVMKMKDLSLGWRTQYDASAAAAAANGLDDNEDFPTNPITTAPSTTGGPPSSIWSGPPSAGAPSSERTPVSAPTSSQPASQDDRKSSPNLSQ